MNTDKWKIDLLLTNQHVWIRHLLKTCNPEFLKYWEVLVWKQSIGIISIMMVGSDVKWLFWSISYNVYIYIETYKTRSWIGWR